MAIAADSFAHELGVNIAGEHAHAPGRQSRYCMRRSGQLIARNALLDTLFECFNSPSSISRLEPRDRIIPRSTRFCNSRMFSIDFFICFANLCAKKLTTRCDGIGSFVVTVWRHMARCGHQLQIATCKFSDLIVPRGVASQLLSKIGGKG